MKKFVSILLVFAMCLSLTACKSAEVKNVESLIDAIGEVTLDSEGAVVTAEDAYAALNEEDKAEVANYATLVEARSLLDALIYEAEMNAKYDSAIALLNEERLEEAYAAFVELGDWKDAAKYVARFTVHENILLESSVYEVNAFGEENLAFTYAYEYDTQGHRLCGPAEELPVVGYYEYMYYTYDENGNLIERRYENIRGTYYYDENGALERIEDLCANYDKITIFYEDGLMTVHQTACSSGDTLVESYTYGFDDAGRVSKRMVTIENAPSWVSAPNIFYEYDSEGRLAKVIRQYDTNTLDFIYIYENGILARCESHRADGNLLSYSSYVYGDYYIYTPAE